MLRSPFFWVLMGICCSMTGTAENEIAVFTVGVFGTAEFVRWSGAGLPSGFAPDGTSVYVKNAVLQEWSLGNAAQMMGSRGTLPFRAGSLSGIQWIRFSEIVGRALIFSTGPDSGQVFISKEGDFTVFDPLDIPGNKHGTICCALPAMSADGGTVVVVMGIAIRN